MNLCALLSVSGVCRSIGGGGIIIQFSGFCSNMPSAHASSIQTHTVLAIIAVKTL